MKVLETNIRVNDIELANQIISKMNKTHFDQLDEIATLRAQNAELQKLVTHFYIALGANCPDLKDSELMREAEPIAKEFIKNAK